MNKIVDPTLKGYTGTPPDRKTGDPLFDVNWFSGEATFDDLMAYIGHEKDKLIKNKLDVIKQCRKDIEITRKNLKEVYHNLKDLKKKDLKKNKLYKISNGKKKFIYGYIKDYRYDTIIFNVVCFNNFYGYSSSTRNGTIEEFMHINAYQLYKLDITPATKAELPLLIAPTSEAYRLYNEFEALLKGTSKVEVE